jgi:hypothetical protein
MVRLNSIRYRTAFESEPRDISVDQACGTDKSDVDVCDSTVKRSICPSFFTHRANPPVVVFQYNSMFERSARRQQLPNESAAYAFLKSPEKIRYRKVSDHFREIFCANPAQALFAFFGLIVRGDPVKRA